jgi:hypothetical protein
MKKSIVVLIIIGIVVIIAAATNPNKSRHKEVLESKIKTYMQKSMKGENNEFALLLGSLLGNAVVSIAIDKFVSTDNYILFSTTKLTWQGETKVIGFGAFGNVFISEKLNEINLDDILNEVDLDDALNEVDLDDASNEDS